MAMPSAAEWDVRANGAATNGGFFNSARGGTDYSQQDAAQLALADIQTDMAGDGLYSSTGGFTAAMAGNGIYLSGGTGTAGWYEIVSVTDSNNCTIDRVYSNSETGITGNVGGAVVFSDALLEAVVAGNVIHVKSDGTHTLGADAQTANDGSATAPIQILGYNSSHNDAPTGTDRPLIAGGSYTVWVDTYWELRHLRVTSTNTYSVHVSTYCRTVNCSISNTSGTANKYALYMVSNRITAVGCELTSTNGRAVLMSGGGCRLIGCYVHDSAVGVWMSYHFDAVIDSIIDTCTDGILTDGAHDGCFVYGSTIYNCTDGLDLASGTNGFVAWNCTFSDCGTAVKSGNDLGGSHLIDYNNWYNNTTDVSNVDKGANAMAVDPGFADAAGGDFTPGANLEEAAWPQTYPGGTGTSYKTLGALQAEGGGGGAAPAAYACVG